MLIGPRRIQSKEDHWVDLQTRNRTERLIKPYCYQLFTVHIAVYCIALMNNIIFAIVLCGVGLLFYDDLRKRHDMQLNKS